MIRPALMLTLSGYGWYLIFTHTYPFGLPAYGCGLAGLIFVAVLPVLFGFAAARNTVTGGPTVLKLVLVTFLQYLIYALAVALGFAVFAGYYQIASFLPPALWQLLCWTGGSYAAVSPPQPAGRDRSAHLRAVETSLLLMIPVVFLLTFMDYPTMLVLTLALSWFTALAFTLALAGINVLDRTVIRHDLIALHILIPLITAALLFYLAFSREMHLFLQTARETLGTVIRYLLYLLDLLFSRKSYGDVVLREMNDPVPPARPEMLFPERELPFWILLPLLVVAAGGLFIALRALLELLRTRLKPPPAVSTRRFSFWEFFLQICSRLTALLKNLLEQIITLFEILQILLHRARLKIAGIIRSFMPAGTPSEEIVRSYRRFLRWGRRRGCPYRFTETPLEYAVRLRNTARKRAYPGIEIERLTSIFLETRYGCQPANSQQSEVCTALLKTILSNKRTRQTNRVSQRSV